MATTISISQRELERVAQEAYIGKTFKVILCQIGTTGYNAQTLLSSWEAIELPIANGYTPFSEVITAGSYSNSLGAYALPELEVSFTSVNAGYNYDTLVCYIDGSLYPHSIIRESPVIALGPGQTRMYKVYLRQDD